MILQQKMGTVFLAGSVLLALVISTLANAGQILLPQTPKPVRPPSRGEAGAKEDFERKKQHLDRKIERHTPEPPSPSEVRSKKLLEEALTPTPLDVGLTISFLYNFVNTSGAEREDYTVDPSAHLALFYRPIKSRDSSQVNLWLGARGYFVGGTGAYKGVRGRYSFSYYGPMVGLGKFSPGISSVGQDVAKDPSSAPSEMLSRHGFFALTGIAAQSRLSQREAGDEEPEDDLDNAPIAFDSPGIWAEVWYANLRYNAISLQAFAGAQTGKQKTFYYVGIGTGGWR